MSWMAQLSCIRFRLPQNARFASDHMLLEVTLCFIRVSTCFAIVVYEAAFEFFVIVLGVVLVTSSRRSVLIVIGLVWYFPARAGHLLLNCILLDASRGTTTRQ